MALDFAAVDRVLEAHRAMLMAVPGVVGTAIGRHDDALCIIVFVTASTVAASGAIPGTLDGIRVKIEVSGRLDARPQ